MMYIRQIQILVQARTCTWLIVYTNTTVLSYALINRGQLYLIYHIMVSATLQSLISNFIFLGNYISWKLYFRISRQIPLDSVNTASRFGTAISPLQISEKSHTASSEQTAPKKVTSP